MPSAGTPDNPHRPHQVAQWRVACREYAAGSMQARMARVWPAATRKGCRRAVLGTPPNPHGQGKRPLRGVRTPAPPPQAQQHPATQSQHNRFKRVWQRQGGRRAAQVFGGAGTQGVRWQWALRCHRPEGALANLVLPLEGVHGANTPRHALLQHTQRGTTRGAHGQATKLRQVQRKADGKPSTARVRLHGVRRANHRGRKCPHLASGDCDCDFTGGAGAQHASRAHACVVRLLGYKRRMCVMARVCRVCAACALGCSPPHASSTCRLLWCCLHGHTLDQNHPPSRTQPPTLARSVLIVKKPLAARATAALDGLLPLLSGLGITSFFEPVVWAEMASSVRGYGDRVQRFPLPSEVRLGPSGANAGAGGGGTRLRWSHPRERSLCVRPCCCTLLEHLPGKS
jgi:hypothetical protein